MDEWGVLKVLLGLVARIAAIAVVPTVGGVVPAPVVVIIDVH